MDLRQHLLQRVWDLEWAFPKEGVPYSSESDQRRVEVEVDGKKRVVDRNDQINQCLKNKGPSVSTSIAMECMGVAHNKKGKG